MCGFCLPYLSKEDSLKLISDVAGLLNANGVFYISTMEDDYSKSGFKRSNSGDKRELYIHYHQEDYLTHTLRQNGFETIQIFHKDYPEHDGTFTKDLVLIAQKQENGIK